MTNDNNMLIWDSVCKTDPAHTKVVEFGRRFTSIDAHWQIMQATRLFGPVGKGWRYDVTHSVERLTDTIILAVADVMLVWRDGDDWQHFGPVRATCEMYGPKTYKGKVIPGEFITDEDAPKKAMTDALTKGLSHLGFSADVFLGLFDDNRYVQKMKREFDQLHIPGGGPIPPVEPESMDLVRKDAINPVTGEIKSQYQIDAAKAAAKFADDLIGTIKLSGQTRDSLTELWKANARKLSGLEERHPAQYERVVRAHQDAMDGAAA